MDKTSPIVRLFIFLILIFAGIIIGMFASLIPSLVEGFTFEELQHDPSLIMERGSSTTLKLSLFLNHLFLFILPSLIFGFIIFGKQFRKGFDLEKIPTIKILLLSVGFLLFSYPLVNFAHLINSYIPLADWMISNEQDVAAMLKKIMGSKSPIAIIINVLLIAVMPAVGEELVFRGIIQKNIAKWARNPHIGIWIAAFIFSAIHMQFEGFLARMTLGAILGYSYYLTRNFWVPIFLHFLNNLIPLLVFVFMDVDLTATDDPTSQFKWISMLIPLLGVPALLYLFSKNNEEQRKLQA